MPMSGIKIVEACSNIAGPVTGTIFGDLGAEVVKIEKPNGGDDARGWSPPMLHGVGARFQAINRNKRSVTLELKNPHDQDELRRLVAEADVFVHNMRPGVAESLGLSGSEALALNPRLVYCAIGAYGAKGPWRTWSAYDGLAQALSSQMYGNGEPDGQPLLVADAIVDKGAGMWAAIAILAALHDRTKTGKGSVVETSLLEAALFWRDGVFAQYVASGRPPRRPGNGSVQIVPYGVFPTADRPIMLGLAGDGLFAAFAKLIGRGEWINDERFAKNSARVANRSVLEPMIEEALASRNRDEWVELLGSNGIPCAPILDPAEAFHHPQVQALGIFQSPPDLEMPLVSAPWSINGVRPPVRRRAPLLGEDNEAILRPVRSSTDG
ncbi:CaiB/BaiF CoA transferase family protein [Bradyrhizobium genosp. P]|uniref:CaiB/BaiF CoA transferase family protein n=1 Tax=Bradyrhizobium genosp. P TaxID=83641 RepID=UPI003CF26182